MCLLTVCGLQLQMIWPGSLIHMTFSQSPLQSLPILQMEMEDKGSLFTNRDVDFPETRMAGCQKGQASCTFNSCLPGNFGSCCFSHSCRTCCTWQNALLHTVIKGAGGTTHLIWLFLGHKHWGGVSTGVPEMDHPLPGFNSEKNWQNTGVSKYQ